MPHLPGRMPHRPLMSRGGRNMGWLGTFMDTVAGAPPQARTFASSIQADIPGTGEVVKG
jgi:hypothetical protein